MPRSRASHVAVTLLAMWGLSGCARGPAAADLRPSTPESRAAAGAQWFGIYCVSCHGAHATGDGPVAPALRTPPADLTRIAERTEGRFDAAAVARFIDGRNRVEAHGPTDMPVWGRHLDDRNLMIEQETRLAPGTIYLIVEYLRSIQI